MSRTRLTLLGGLQLIVDDQPVSGFRSYKGLALLAYLAAHDKPVLRSALAGLLWGDQPDAKASANLRKTLSNLNELAPGCVQADKLNAWLGPDVVCDLRQFRATTGEAAADLMAGELLSGFALRDCPEFETWLLAERERVRQQASVVLQQLVSHHTLQRNHARAAHCARQLLALEPWHEEMHRQLMLLLARSGQRTAALEQFHICQRVLAEAFGLPPGAETMMLHERIRAAPAQATLPPTTGEFFGRAADLTAIGRRLDDPACRLLTLIGPGGMGKSRLAQQVAADRGLSDFLNGMLFVALAGIAPRSFALLLANAFGCPTNGSADVNAQLLKFLRNRELLLVLDNFESLLSAPDGAPLDEALVLLTEILQQAPGVKLLVTSRERLLVPDEWIHAVHGLADADATQLFAHAAQRAQPGFRLGVENFPAVQRIIQLTQGMPLAIELAASLTRVLGCDDIALELAQGLDVLSSSTRGIPERQRSVRAAFEPSWRRLSSQEQDLFAALSIFEGGFDREAALAVSGARLPELTQLVDKSLLAWDGQGRYSMHALLRQFCAGKQSVATHSKIAGLHAGHFANRIAALHPALQGPGVIATVAAIQRELPNVRIAWRHLITQRAVLKLGQMVAALTLYFDCCAGFVEAGQLFGQAVDGMDSRALSEQPDALEFGARHAHGRLLGGLSWVLWQRRRYDEAEALATRMLSMLDIKQDPAGHSLGLFLLGTCRAVQGNYEQAADLFRGSLEVATKHALHWQAATTLVTMAQFAIMLGQSEQLDEILARCLTLCETLGELRMRAFALYNRGNLSLSRSQFDSALTDLNEALHLFRQFNGAPAIVNVLDARSRAYAYLDRDAEAEQDAHEMLALCRASDDSLGEAHACAQLTHIYSNQNRVAEARVFAQRALTLAQKINNAWVISVALYHLAEIDTQLDDLEACLSHAGESRAAAVRAGAPLGVARADVLIGRAAALRGHADDATRARRAFASAAQWTLDVGDVRRGIVVLYNALDVLADLDAPELAQDIAAFLLHSPQVMPHQRDRAGKVLANTSHPAGNDPLPLLQRMARLA